jgi:very-short-patch-repair endonuclease
MWTENRRPLRSWVEEKLATLNTHATLRAACERFGITGEDVDGSKRERAAAATRGMTDRQIAAAAERMALEYRDPQMQEAALAVLEADDAPITEITRIDVARCFHDTNLSGERPIIEFLRKLWPIDASFLGEPFEGLAPAIQQHMIRNDDWSVEDLFHKLGAFKCSRKRFVLTIEAALDPRARRGEEQERLRGRIDTVLRRDGYKVEKSALISGYPTYRVIRMSDAVAGAPKNLIFASAGPKPEIGFADAINNDIVILSNERSCLVYERPIADDGLLWDELVAWWQETHCVFGTDEQSARKGLGKRLQKSLQSEGERGLFGHYFKLFQPRLGAALPALIPQVYLHYDPATISQLRKGKRLARQRMDFLLLLPHRNRVVIEVDGAQHFSEPTGEPSLAKYAEMVRSDRDLRLLGYEVYRFAANELVGAGAGDVVKSMFERLFRKHSVGGSAGSAVLAPRRVGLEGSPAP